jgi:hypothetical protein
MTTFASLLWGPTSGHSTRAFPDAPLDPPEWWDREGVECRTCLSMEWDLHRCPLPIDCGGCGECCPGRFYCYECGETEQTGCKCPERVAS